MYGRIVYGFAVGLYIKIMDTMLHQRLRLSIG